MKSSHPQIPTARPVRLERSTLFAPGSQASMLEKAARSAADAVCLDLEDSVSFDLKPEARARVIEALHDLDFGHRIRIVRINALDTPFAYRDIVDVVEAAGDRIDALMLPKASGAPDVVFVETLLRQIEMHAGLARAIGIEAQIETAGGLVNVREIAAASARLEALIFGPGDFAASMQMPSSGIGAFDAADEAYPGHRWHAVMFSIAAAARAVGLRCIDGPYAAYKDLDGLARSCAIARALGYDGKQCIHPAQLEAVNEAFTPAAEEVADAQRIVDASREAANAGRGSASLDGKMIDAASVRIAWVVLEKARMAQQNRGPHDLTQNPSA